MPEEKPVANPTPRPKADSYQRALCDAGAFLRGYLSRILAVRHSCAKPTVFPIPIVSLIP